MKKYIIFALLLLSVNQMLPALYATGKGTKKSSKKADVEADIKKIDEENLKLLKEIRTFIVEIYGKGVDRPIKTLLERYKYREILRKPIKGVNASFQKQKDIFTMKDREYIRIIDQYFFGEKYELDAKDFQDKIRYYINKRNKTKNTKNNAEDLKQENKEFLKEIHDPFVKKYGKDKEKAIKAFLEQDKKSEGEFTKKEIECLQSILKYVLNPKDDQTKEDQKELKKINNILNDELRDKIREHLDIKNTKKELERKNLEEKYKMFCRKKEIKEMIKELATQAESNEEDKSKKKKEKKKRRKMLLKNYLSEIKNKLKIVYTIQKKIVVRSVVSLDKKKVELSISEDKIEKEPLNVDVDIDDDILVLFKELSPTIKKYIQKKEFEKNPYKTIEIFLRKVIKGQNKNNVRKILQKLSPITYYIYLYNEPIIQYKEIIQYRVNDFCNFTEKHDQEKQKGYVLTYNKGSKRNKFLKEHLTGFKNIVEGYTNKHNPKTVSPPKNTLDGKSSDGVENKTQDITTEDTLQDGPQKSPIKKVPQNIDNETPEDQSSITEKEVETQDITTPNTFQVNVSKNPIKEVPQDLDNETPEDQSSITEQEVETQDTLQDDPLKSPIKEVPQDLDNETPEDQSFITEQEVESETNPKELVNQDSLDIIKDNGKKEPVEPSSPKPEEDKRENTTITEQEEINKNSPTNVSKNNTDFLLKKEDTTSKDEFSKKTNPKKMIKGFSLAGAILIIGSVAVVLIGSSNKKSKKQRQ